MVHKVYKRYIDQFIHGFNINKKQDKYIFVKHYNTFNISKQDVNSIISKYESDILVLFHEYDACKIQKPYEPILDWIKEIYIKHFKEQLSIDEFLEEANVYPLHKPIIRSYIETGVCKRKEELIIYEVKYEQDQFLHSVLNIICNISMKLPLVIVLNKLHVSNQSILQLISNFLECNNQKQIAILCTYNEAYEINSYMSEVWNSLIEKAESMNIVCEWGIEEEEEKIFEDKKGFVPIASEFEEYVTEINNMVKTLSLKQAYYYLNLIYNKFDIGNVTISYWVKVQFLALFASTNLYLDDVSNAMLLCDSIRNICELENDDRGLFKSNYICGLAQIHGGQYLIGENFASKCKELAIKLNDDYLLFKAELLAVRALFRGWKGLLLIDKEIILDENIFDKVISYGYDNHLAYIYILIYEKDENEANNIFDNGNSFDYFEKSISIAEKLRNNRFIMLAYKKMITLASFVGRYEIADMYYEKCIEVVKRINDKHEEIEIFNGLGYNSIVSERYFKANENFNSALEIAYGLNDLDEMSETLYNMGVNAFAAGNYLKAKEYLLLVIKLIESKNSVTIRVCNISKIYGLVALSYYYLDVEYNCYVYFNRMKRILTHLLEPDGEVSYKLWDDDLFLYYFIKFLIEVREKRYLCIDNSLKKAEKHMRISTGSMFYTFPLFASEIAKYYRSVGKEDKANEILLEVMEFCEGNGYVDRYNSIFTMFKNIDGVIHKYDLELKNLTVKDIINAAKRVGLEIELEEQRKELAFLAIWQNTLGREFETKKDLINNSIVTLKNNFSIERIVFISVKPDGDAELEYSDENTYLTECDVDKIVHYFTKNDMEFIVCRNDNSIELYTDIIDVFGRNNVFSMIGIPIFVQEKLHSILIAYIPVYDNFVENKYILNERHLFIIRYILNQLLDAINKLNIRKEIEKMNKKLHKNLITDILTGIYNRQGFDKIMKANKSVTTFLYIDLDNFKYYNDTYGHDVGDFILVKFAQVFKMALNGSGYEVRYGGDEFILGIPNSSDEDGVLIARRIFQKIKSKEFIEPICEKISEYEGQFQCVPLTCSIGIATSETPDEKSLMKAITNADKALYEVKNMTKNGYKVWGK